MKYKNGEILLHFDAGRSSWMYGYLKQLYIGFLIASIHIASYINIAIMDFC